MKIDFLENGIDSLKKGFENLIKYEDLLYKNDSKSKRQRAFYLKDAILYTQHGIEILIKKILQNHSEYLVFSNIDSHVKSAFKERNSNKNIKSLFETSVKHKIHTVAFSEAIERLKIIPNVVLTQQLEKRLLDLEVLRNILMHSEAHFTESDINSTFEGLSDELDLFFLDNLGKYDTISGYKDLKDNIKTFKEILEKKDLLLKGQALEIFNNALKVSRISLGVNEIKRVTDINKCTKFLEHIFQSNLSFGADMYNGYTTGDVVKFKRKANDLFEFYTVDNDGWMEVKLKSILIYLPEIENDLSPLLFLECDEIPFSEEEYPECDLGEIDGVQFIHYIREIKTNTPIYNPDKIEYLEQTKTFFEKHKNYVRFFTKGIFCFINVQGLDYIYQYDTIVRKHKDMDGKQFEIGLRNLLTKKTTA